MEMVDLTINAMASGGSCDFSMSERFRDASIDGFEPLNPTLEKARDVVARYAMCFGRIAGNGTGLYIWGPVGTGKTHLAAALCHELRAAGAGPVEACGVQRMLDDARAQDGHATPDTDGRLEFYRDVPVLVLDNVGFEWITPSGCAALLDVLDSRARAKRPTILASCFDPHALASRMEDAGARGGTARAIAARVVESSIMVPLLGGSYRLRLRERMMRELGFPCGGAAS